MGQMAVFLEQENFRVRNDTNTANFPSGASWICTQNQTTPVYVVPQTTFRVRFTVNNSGSANWNDQAALFVSYKGAAYVHMDSTGNNGLQWDTAASVDVTNLGFTIDKGNMPIAGMSPGDSPSVADDGAYAEGDNTADAIIEQNGQSNIVLQTDEWTEIEVGLSTDGTVVDGDWWDLRLYKWGGGSPAAFDAYDFTPRIEVLDKPQRVAEFARLPEIIYRR